MRTSAFVPIVTIFYLRQQNPRGRGAPRMPGPRGARPPGPPGFPGPRFGPRHMGGPGQFRPRPGMPFPGPGLPVKAEPEVFQVNYSFL